VFLKEEDHRHEGRVVNSRMGFQKLSGVREDEGYKGNTQTHFGSIKKRILIFNLLEGN